MQISAQVQRLIITCAALATIFLVTLAVIWLFGGETWKQSTLLVDATVFGVVSVISIWVVDRHLGGQKPPRPPLQLYVPPDKPFDYAG